MHIDNFPVQLNIVLQNQRGGLDSNAIRYFGG